MDRWRILDVEQTASDRPDQQARKKPAEPDQAIARGTTSPFEEANKTISQPLRVERARLCEPRTQHNIQNRSYALRNSEIRAMAELGTFRTVDVSDLVRFAYQGDEERMNQDIRSLRSQALVEEKTIYRAHRQPRRILTLTEQGQRILRNVGYVAGDQRLYHGFVKPREVDHDADLYKVYQKEVEEIQRQGGQITKVRLDFELKGAVNRDREAAGNLSAGQKQAWLRVVARQHGLSIKGGTIQLPDIQVEYKTAEGTLAHANIELVSENYRGDALRSKTGAGFRVYVRAGDANRVKRALQDTGAVEEILSI